MPLLPRSRPRIGDTEGFWLAGPGDDHNGAGRVVRAARAYLQMVLRFGATCETAVSVRRPVEDVLL